MKFFNRFKDDRGASHTISFIIIIFFVMIMLVSFIDVGLYFNVKNQMTAAAENGARSVALYGGTDNIVRDTRGGIPAAQVVRDSIPIYDSSNTVVDSSYNILCEPSGRGEKIKAGDTVYCQVTYLYNGIAGSFGLFNLGGQDVTVMGTSVSEVTIE